MIKKIFLSIVFLSSILYSNESTVDCLIIEEENSIICKYTHERTTEEKMIKIEWIEPNGEITRSRDMIIPAGHGSVYDFRYLKGRTIGKWTVQITDNNEIFKANFIID